MLFELYFILELYMKKLKPYYIILVIFCLAFTSIANAKDIRIALRAHQGAAKAISLWQATADHLSKHIPEHRFILVPFENIGVMNQAVSRGDFQVTFANPSAVVEYKLLYNFEPVVSLVNKRQGKGYSKFGSVIFTRADRTDINNFKDLKNKSLISVDEFAFGGWRVAWKEFLDNGINPYDYFNIVRFAGGAQQDVVYAVRDKKDDVGVVRTDMLERLARTGKINLEDFKVIGQKKTEGFPFLHSTTLYPEWAFSLSQDIDTELRNKIIKALLLITEKDTAAIKGMYVKWIAALDYSSVNKLLKDLKVGPYNVATMGKYQRLVSQYGVMLFTITVAFTFLVVAFLYVLKLNRNILAAKELLKEEIGIRVKLERQLLHSQRIESLGQLTGGIAHDFNNMLASILGFTELALYSDTVKNDEKLTQYLNQVVTASEKSSALVNQMLAFSRTANDNDEKEVLSVSALINEVYGMLQPMLPSSLNLVVKNIDDDLYINVNTGMMTQVLMNLYLNSKDAIKGDHGIISIGAEVVSYNALDVFCDSCHQDIRGSYISIYVKDNGSGIDADTKQHLFDPFFTTKEVGKGTGMGLSMVHGITHKNDGHLIVESEVNKGTTIKVLIPQVSGDKKTNKENNSISELVSSTEQTNKGIMVVDDEEAITIYLSEFLRQKGFRVFPFNNSEESLSYFENNFNDIDLVITDQTMPNLTGIELLDEIEKISSDTPVILCSGYVENKKNKIKFSENYSYLKKPIQSNELMEMIVSLLNISH